MKRIIMFFYVTLLSLYVQAVEIPKELLAFLDGKDEKIYTGQTKSGYGCEFRFFKNQYGFFIEGYERNASGEIDYNYDYARFILDESRELYEYFANPFYGVEAQSRYFSSAGASFDTRAFFNANMTNGKLRDLYLKYQKHNSYFFYTTYKLECIINYTK